MHRGTSDILPASRLAFQDDETPAPRSLCPAAAKESFFRSRSLLPLLSVQPEGFDDVGGVVGVPSLSPLAEKE